MSDPDDHGAAPAGATFDDTDADGFDLDATDAEDFGDGAGQASTPAPADPYGLEDLAEAYGFAPDDALAVLARDHCQSGGLAPEQFSAGWSRATSTWRSSRPRPPTRPSSAPSSASGGRTPGASSTS